MSRRVQLGLKLALTSAGFLCLTVLAALGLRGFLQSDQDRSPASIEGGSVFEHRGNLSATELGLLGSTPLIRGRRVVFHDVQFRNLALTAPNQVVLNLFPDLSMTAQMQSPSVYSVNDGLYVGQIQGDSESSVRILIQNGIVDGTIETGGNEYRIIDAANGQSIITQAKNPKQ
jgi:hypothetical protein